MQFERNELVLSNLYRHFQIYFSLSIAFLLFSVYFSETFGIFGFDFLLDWLILIGLKKNFVERIAFQVLLQVMRAVFTNTLASRYEIVFETSLICFYSFFVLGKQKQAY